MKDILAALSKSKRTVIGLSICLAVLSYFLVHIVLSIAKITDLRTILVAIVCLVVVGLVAVWADNRFTAKYGNIPRGYV